MLPKERREWIEKQLITQGKVDIEELSQQLNVSTMTIRRDLALLEREGKIVRTHGGAIHPRALIQETPYSTKKKRILSGNKPLPVKRLSSSLKMPISSWTPGPPLLKSLSSSKIEKT